MKKSITFILAIVMLSVFFLSGCEVQPPVDYKLENVYVDPIDIKISYANQDSSRLCFDVNNNAQTTLLSQIEVTFDENGKKCFQSIDTKKLSEIPPKESKHTCLDLRLPYNSNKESYKEECGEKRFEITVSLQDVGGVELDKGVTHIGII